MMHDACNRMDNLNVRHLNTCMQTGWKINKVGLGVISPKFTFDQA